MISSSALPLGDRHDGKQTCLVTDGEQSYIFKPRNADTERAWESFLCALRSAGFSLLPGCVEILSEDETGHRETPIPHSPTSTEALPDYFRRCGATLFFTWLFGSTDLHAENLIACGDIPVLVDLETLFSGVEARTKDSKLQSLAWSVYRTHLLPQFDGKTDISGFSGTNAEGKNLPLVGDDPPFVSDYVDEICEGFTSAFRFAQKHRGLIEDDIRGFSHCRFRVLLRPTDTYGKMTKLLELLPEEQRPLYAQALIRPAYERDIDPERAQKAAGAIREEADAIVRGDVPLFAVYGDGLDLYCRDEVVISEYLRISPIDFALQRLTKLSDAELEKQIKLIRLSYDALLPLKSENICFTADTSALQALDDCAIPNHPTSFIHLASDNSGKGYFESAGWGLYDGLSGILCAYGAVYHRSGDSAVLDRMRELYVSLPAALSGGKLALTDQVCSLGDGFGGMIAALLHLADLTGEARFRDDAFSLVARLDPEQFKAETTDILNGSGGLCLQLPKLPRELAHPLAKAILPLFQNAKPTLTGFAHGAAGQALCLAALQHVLPEHDLRKKILDLLSWENEKFNVEKNNWPDLRRGNSTDFMGGWCSGAPGIGLARKRMLQYMDDPEIAAICRQDIARSVRWLKQAPFGHRDTLCCGNSARLVAAARLGTSTAQFAKRISGSCAPNSPRLYHMLNTADKNPGLMQGAGGVIYTLALKDDPLIGDMLL